MSTNAGSFEEFYYNSLPRWGRAEDRLLTHGRRNIHSPSMTSPESQPVEPEPLYCPTCAEVVPQPLRCGDCGALICQRCGTPVEQIDELGIG